MLVRCPCVPDTERTGQTWPVRSVGVRSGVSLRDVSGALDYAWRRCRSAAAAPSMSTLIAPSMATIEPVEF